jgi:hypothetical protein
VYERCPHRITQIAHPRTRQTQAEKLTVDVDITPQTSVDKIRKARKHLKEMPKLKKIELMVLAGAMTEEQAEKARQKLEEI